MPFQTDKEYPKARDRAEALLTARKTTHNFPQAKGSNVPKSSLDGARESVIPETEYPERRDSDDEKYKKIHNLYKHYRARQGEQLSGVDLLKRLGEPKSAPKFRSTSHLAALPFLERIGEDKKKHLFSTIKNLVRNKVWELSGDKDWVMDDQDVEPLVFESRLSDWIPAEAISDTLRKQYSDALNDSAGDLKPNPYYALLAADGDNMGIVIDAQKVPKAHRDLSRALSEFADQAPGIVIDSQGVLIYSGGDDVLAYLPLHTVLECAKKLEDVFRRKLQTFKATKGGKPISPTLSIGIIIAHHLEPLSDVLELAREAERIAKKVDSIQKNGLAITLSKRGGADRTISGKWGIFDKRLNQLIGFTQTDAISAGTAYELQELHRVLSKTGIPADGLAKEALRIVGRKQESGGGKAVSKEVKEAFKKWLVTDTIPLDELAKEMIVANVFVGDSETTEEPKEVSS